MLTRTRGPALFFCSLSFRIITDVPTVFTHLRPMVIIEEEFTLFFLGFQRLSFYVVQLYEQNHEGNSKKVMFMFHVLSRPD